MLLSSVGAIALIESASSSRSDIVIGVVFVVDVVIGVVFGVDVELAPMSYSASIS